MCRLTLTLGIVVASLLLPRPCLAVGVTIEVTDAAEALLDSRLARRLITLELADVELPPSARNTPSRDDKSAKGVRRSEVVFVRLLADADVLTVELWAQGILTGERRIRVAGTEEHQARRVALASAELARHVRESRLSERQRMLREHLVTSAADAPSYSVALNLGAGVDTRAIWLPALDAVLIGPQVSLWARSKQGLGVGLHAAYHHTATLQGLAFWSEVGVRPSWELSLGGELDVGFGLSAAAALIDVGQGGVITHARESQQTWGARASADARVSYRLSSRASLTFGPELGLLLRELTVQSRTDGETNVRGLWIGLGLGAEWFL